MSCRQQTRSTRRGPLTAGYAVTSNSSRNLAPGPVVGGLIAALPASAFAAEIPRLDAAIPAIWALLPGLLAVGALIACAVLGLRLHAAADAERAHVADLQGSNAKLYRQLNARTQELSARDRELAELRLKLEQLSQEKSDFLAVTSHRLRQTLEALFSTLNLLGRGAAAETGQLIAAAERQGQTLRETIEEMQRLSHYEAVELAPPAAPLPRPPANGGLAILLVENGRHDSLRGQLESLGHRVLRQGNGMDAVEAALREKFELILLDAQLPLMDGVETAQKIRRSAGRELPIFALVDGLRSGDKERYIAEGLTGVLARPLMQTQLQQLLNWVARRSGKRPQASPPPAQKPAAQLRILNSGTLAERRDMLGHLAFAELLGERIATLPKKTTALTSALTGRHWMDAQQGARLLGNQTRELGLEAAAARLHTLAENLGVDAEREYCRHQRTEILNLMRESVQELKGWREKNVHTEWALR